MADKPNIVVIWGMTSAFGTFRATTTFACRTEEKELRSEHTT
jgi:hypothetical protein